MPKRKFYKDETNPYDYIPENSTPTEFRDEEKSAETSVPEFVGAGNVPPIARALGESDIKNKAITNSDKLQIDSNGNIVADSLKVGKLFYKRFTVTPSLESLDGWKTSIVGTGASITPQVGLVTLIGGNVVGNTTIMYIEQGVNISTDWNPTFQCYSILSLETIPLGDVFIGFGNTSPYSASPQYIGFELLASGNVLSATIKKSTQSAEKVTITGIATDIFHSYKINVNNTEKKVYFYIDDILKATIIYSGVILDSDFSILLAIKSQNASNSHVAKIGGLFYSQDF